MAMSWVRPFTAGDWSRTESFIFMRESLIRDRGFGILAHYRILRTSAAVKARSTKPPSLREKEGSVGIPRHPNDHEDAPLRRSDEGIRILERRCSGYHPTPGAPQPIRFT